MSQVRLATAAVLAAALLATACTPTADPPAQTPTPSPTFSCSTSTVSDPCTPEKAAKEKEEATAVAEATESFKSFYVEFQRIGEQGGSTETPTSLRRFSGGPYLSAFAGYLKELKQRRLRYSGGIQTVRFTFLPGEKRTRSPDNEMTFSFCVDGRRNRILNSSGRTVATGVVIAGRMYVRPSGGRYILWDSNDMKAKSC